MKIATSLFTIAEINDQIKNKALLVNNDYQRSPHVWPADARSYFIDTILEGYPFPKIFFYELYDPKKRAPVREIVDGQQRVTTFLDFFNNGFKLSKVSHKYAGMRFDDLSEDLQRQFAMTPVHVDLILLAERPEIFEMFRRMNSYTAPLNPAEKRHSEFQGAFKWFVNELADAYSPLLAEFGIFTPKQLLRMADSEFITELVQVLDAGIVNKQTAALRRMYATYDGLLPQQDQWRSVVVDFFGTLAGPLAELKNTFLMRSYAVHSLFCAMTQRKYGIPGGAHTVGVETVGYYFNDLGQTLNNLTEIAFAHEIQDLAGMHADYVEAAMSTTHRIAQRAARTRALAKALV